MIKISEEEKEITDILYKCLFWFVGEKCEIGKDEIRKILKFIGNQQKEIEELKNNELDYTTIYINGVYEGKKYYKDKIRELLKSKDIELTGVISYRELEELL